MSGTPPVEPPVHPIEVESYAIMAARIDLGRWPSGARDVVARMVHATADETFVRTARIGAHAVPAATAALRAGAAVVCDSRMVAAGIPAVAAALPVLCYLDRVAGQPPGRGTRSEAAIDAAAAEHPEGALWVIGNAPTALRRLVALHRGGRVAPAAVVGLPVGYVGAAESKQELWTSELAAVSITNEGRRGGSPVAAAALNALFRLARSEP